MTLWWTNSACEGSAKVLEENRIAAETRKAESARAKASFILLIMDFYYVTDFYLAYTSYHGFLVISDNTTYIFSTIANMIYFDILLHFDMLILILAVTSRESAVVSTGRRPCVGAQAHQ